MKALLTKLLSLFKQPEPTKPVEPWPFPEQVKEMKATPKKTRALPAKATVAKAAGKKSIASKKAK
jgi:hypothetical protein